jgi:hypothetical protein
MSSAFYPQGMKSYNNYVPNGGYKSWKGTGALSNPVGIAPGHIRPLTNKDPGNVFQTGPMLPRPIKHYRKGRVIPSAPIVASDTDTYSQKSEIAQINYNMNRYVRSSKGTSLGGANNGGGLISAMIDNPGNYIVKTNLPNETNEMIALNNDCKTCEGVGVVVSYYPNNTYITDNPDAITQSPLLCCNEQYKAKRRAIYASTNLKKNYYTTLQQYRQNRCKTYEQKSFNFLTPYSTNEIELNKDYPFATPETSYLNVAKAGSPLALTNTYLANCQPNAELYNATENAIIDQMLSIMVNKHILTTAQVTEINNLNIITIKDFFNYLNGLTGSTKTLAIDVFVNYLNNPYWGMPISGPTNQNACKLTVYKPNNYQYAKQGAVSSSTRLLKLNVDTISTNAASLQNYNNTGQLLVNANQLYEGVNNNVANLYKNKAPTCNSPTIYPFQNKKLCYYQKHLPQYQVPASQPAPYRYFVGTVFNSNHYSQSPNTYNTPGRKLG